MSEFINDAQRDNYIVALLEEKSFSERNANTDHVKEIDVELARIGHKAAPKAKRAEKRPADKSNAETR